MILLLFIIFLIIVYGPTIQRLWREGKKPYGLK